MATENPKLNRQFRKQNQFELNVWAGILGHWNVDFLQTNMKDYLKEFYFRGLPLLWFQRQVTDFLTEEFDGRWIGNITSILRFVKSPDLTPLGHFL